MKKCKYIKRKQKQRKSNIFIPGTRPGEATAQLFRNIMNRLSLIGAIYLLRHIFSIKNISKILLRTSPVAPYATGRQGQRPQRPGCSDNGGP